VTTEGRILSNRYLLAEEIGTGGMGNVYRATDLRTGGQVAVKVPHPYLARDPEYVERLRREARIAASLYSPRIVRVIDLDTDENGIPFLVMEYVPGPTLLDELHDRGAFPLADALTLGLETARALDTAHQKGIVHRDLKPHNIKLADGEVKVLDFGIAKAEGLPGMTSASVFMGTPEYSAPERAEGLGDIRSDIYSLGVILYEALAGQLPFSALNPMAVLRKHEQEPPPPLPPDIPEDVSAIVMRCLAKRPEDRYQAPRDLVRDLTAVLRKTPLPTLPAGVHPSKEHSAVTADPPPARPAPLNPTIVDPRGSGARPSGPPLAAAMAPTTDAGSVSIEAPAVATLSRVPPGGQPDETASGLALRPTNAVPAGALRHVRIWAAGAGLAAVLVAGVAWAVAVHDARAPGAAAGPTVAARGSTTAAPAVGASMEASRLAPAGSPARAAGPLARAPVIATIAADHGKNGEERQVLATLDGALKAEVLAARTTDNRGLDAYFTGDALKDFESLVGGLKRQGRYAIADLKQIDVLEISLSSATTATVKTQEQWDYAEYLETTDERVSGYTATQIWTYQLTKQDSRWLVEKSTQIQ
jgi:serine/threonine protein kinase